MADVARVRWQDALLPAAFAAIGIAELASLDMDGRVAGGVLEVLACVLLVFRRRWPLFVGTVAGLLIASPPWVGPAIDEAATGILIAGLAATRWPAGSRACGLIGVGAMLAMILGVYTFRDLRDHGIDDVVFVLALLVPPYVFGRVTRRLAEHAVALKREQELSAATAVRDERDRIARELHDVIAHSVSAMVVQAAAAQDLVRARPGPPRQALQRGGGHRAAGRWPRPGGCCT